MLLLLKSINLLIDEGIVTVIQKMNRFLLTILFAFTFLFGIAQKLPPRPSPPRLVNDFTNTLSPDQVESLERKLVAYDDSTSNQIAIVIVATTDDYAPVDYATKLGREWGIGNKKTNNGVLLLVAKDDAVMNQPRIITMIVSTLP